MHDGQLGSGRARKRQNNQQIYIEERRDSDATYRVLLTPRRQAGRAECSAYAVSSDASTITRHGNDGINRRRLPPYGP